MFENAGLLSRARRILQFGLVFLSFQILMQSVILAPSGNQQGYESRSVLLALEVFLVCEIKRKGGRNV